IIVAAAVVVIILGGLLFLYLIVQARRNELLLRDASSNEEKLRDVLGGLPDAVLIVTDALLIDFANQRAAELTRYSFAELMGLSIDDLLRATPDAEALSTSFAPGKIVTGLTQTLMKKDAREVIVEINVRQHKSADGTKLIAVLRDVSERQAYEQEL